jgi:ABC-type ATPase involved in cell division
VASSGRESELVVEATDLRKSYGDDVALAGVDLAVPAGSVLGLLGPNGAGKTTAVRILTTLLPPDGGRARVAGLDVVADAVALRSRIGLAGQYAAVDENLTGFENLAHCQDAPQRAGSRTVLGMQPLPSDQVLEGERLAGIQGGGGKRLGGLCVALVGLALSSVLAVTPPTADQRLAWVVLALAPQLVVVGGVSLVVCVVGFVVLSELQAQTALRHGQLRRKVWRRVPVVQGVPRPVGGDLRVGRGDSWL